MDRFIQAAAFLMGLVVGSFLNVVIARLPRGESIVRPPSRCPRCKGRIRPWDNIPVLSYLLLRGRCRKCKRAISWRYPTVEILSGVLLLLLVRRVESPLVLVPQAAFLL
ncbi:MAG TPA: prepilin peptidase, partial [Candidatus Eisenbacteria bacterium]|nr:prepilin peptidase [Candidatus Eisenbacteria bacterium]